MGQKRWGRGTSGSPELNILYRHNFHCLGENTAKNWKCFMILMEKPFQKGCAHVQSQPKWLVDSHCPLRKVRSWRSMAYVWTGVKCHGDDGSHDLLMNKCSPSTWAAFLRAPAFFLLCAINTGSLTPCFSLPCCYMFSAWASDILKRSPQWQPNPVVFYLKGPQLIHSRFR